MGKRTAKIWKKIILSQENRHWVVLSIFLFVVLLFTSVYLIAWNINTSGFKIDPEYKLNIFGLNGDPVQPLTEIGSNAAPLKEKQTGLENNLSMILTEDMEKLKAAEANLKNLQQCRASQGFQDATCLLNNNGIYAQIRQAQEALAYHNMTFQNQAIPMISQKLSEQLTAANEGRKRSLNFLDFLLYSLYTSIGRSDPSIAANSTFIRSLNILQIISSIFLLGLIVDGVKNWIRRNGGVHK